ncbi:MAG: hypothetical protein L3K10_08635 [Thermoplasmata archaeon]|nr:hypothetical protein [Thermoplasmata archaeon]
MPYVEYDEVEAVCSDCGRAFRSEEALELHRQDSHQLADPLPAPGLDKRRTKGPAPGSALSSAP